MKNLIKLQIRNLFHNKLFYVCLCLMLLGPIMSSTILSSIVTSEKIKVFPQIVDLFASELGIVSTIFVALFCCFDFNEGTIKNIIARGYTRMQLLLSKYIVSLIGLFSIYGIIILVTFILYIKNGIGYDSSMLYPLINSIFSVIAYMVLYATMSFILEKSSSAMVACLFVPNIIGLAFGFIDSKLKTNIGSFWIDNISDKFIKNPSLGNLGCSVLLYIIYIAIFIFIGYQLIKKKEIK